MPEQVLQIFFISLGNVSNQDVNDLNRLLGSAAFLFSAVFKLNFTAMPKFWGLDFDCAY